MSETPNNLLNEFPSSTHEDWFNQAKKELERLGKDAESILKGNNTDGIAPYLNVDKEGGIPTPILTNRNDVAIHADFTNYSKDNLNAHLLKSLMLGVNSIEIEYDTNTDLGVVLENILPEGVDIQWKTDLNSENIGALARGLNEHFKSVNELKGCVSNDFIGDLLIKGSEKKLGTDWKTKWVDSYKLLANKLPNYHSTYISGDLYMEAGANSVLELSCIMSHLSEYFVIAKDASLDMDLFANRIQIEVGLGVDYFSDIAKLRALRILWSNLLKAYGCNPSIKATVLAKTANRYLSAFDAQLNILRSTTAAMAGTIGGCDKLLIAPFDSTLGSQSEFSLRIARNIHHLLKEESYLEFNHDPSAGSYLIESITNQLAEEAWKSFQLNESKGGLIEILNSNELQNSLELLSNKEERAVKNGERTILGVNKHTGPESEMDKAKMALKSNDTSKSSENFAVKPLRMVRLASIIEAG